MRISKQLSFIVNYFNKFKDIDTKNITQLICLEIKELLNKHYNNEKLNQSEKIILGLRYSEFLTNDQSEEGLWLAKEKQILLLDSLNIDNNLLFESLK